MNTLRGRMIALATGGTAILVVGVIVLTQFLAARASHTDARAIARARADGVASGVRVRQGKLHVVEGPNDFLDTSAWVFDADANLIDGKVPPALLPAARRMARTGRPDYVAQHSNLLYVRPFRVGGSRGAVVASVSLKPYETSERRLLESISLLGLLTVCVAGAVASVVAHRSLAAVHQMTEQADQWREHDLSRRFELGPAHDEITELGRTLDRMLDRIAEALATERRITDEIAHELRTPLAGLRAEAQLGLRQADDSAGATLSRIIVSVDRMNAALGTVLDTARARLDDQSGCDPATVVSEMLLEGESLRAAPGLRPVRVSADVVATMVRPLLDNARRHAQRFVGVELAPADAHVVLRVHDDGPGFPDDAVEAAFAPGWSTSGGYGLGLSVVRRLATAYGVPITVHPGPGGRVELRLPT